MSNLVSVCLAAMFQLFEKKLNNSPSAAYMESIQPKEIPYDEQLLCYLAIFDTMYDMLILYVFFLHFSVAIMSFT